MKGPRPQGLGPAGLSAPLGGRGLMGSLSHLHLAEQGPPFPLRPLELVNVTAFGNKVFADVVKSREGHSVLGGPSQ